MSAEGKETVVPSDAQARGDMLAVYVYEYLIHSGATDAAQNFSPWISCEKMKKVGESPGFLRKFWDKNYTASERRESYEQSSDAKGSHANDSVSLSYGAPADFVPNSSTRPSYPGSGQFPYPQPANLHGQMMGSQRFIGSPPGIRSPQGAGNYFNGPPGQTMMPNRMDPTWQVPQGVSLMNPARGPDMDPTGVGAYGPGMHSPPPNSSLGPGGMPSVEMADGRSQRQPDTSTSMNYSTSSPGYYGGPPRLCGPSIVSSLQASPNFGGENTPMTTEFPMVDCSNGSGPVRNNNGMMNSLEDFGFNMNNYNNFGDLEEPEENEVPTTWSNEDVKILIAAVKSDGRLWNPSDKDYKKTLRHRKRIWEHIANNSAFTQKKDHVQVREKWDHLRQQFSRSYNLMKQKDIFSTWKHYDPLMFLAPVVEQLITASKNSIPQQDSLR